MPIDPQRVRDIFLAAAELPAADRPAHLTEACGADADLRGAVERLLAAHVDPASVLESPAANPLPTTGPHTPQADTGTILAGRYKLLEQIGEGGMGAVWVAQQIELIKRTVAVKLIKPGMDSKTVLARFDAERQALALMDHPNIARVFDAGATTDGRPFFVMELVKGVPITQFCDARRLTPRQRLELFVPVCHAIQHAHQKGVIHRDLKPSNVLVAMYDDQAVPKVIDFGVAKAIGQPLTEHTLHTGFGTVIGTPQYMSPEQATFNNLDVDTRSDIYSLGVLLYELLVGSPPFTRKDLERAGVLEMLRVVREEEPPRPSTKLSTADALPSLAANRGTEPRTLTGMLRNELDWVVMKALEKDRKRRYETANGFAADVLRYLSGESVQAVPPSAGYRMRKFVRKNRGPVIAVSLILLALVGGTIGTVYGVIRADGERTANELRQQAERERDAAATARDGEKAARSGEESARLAAEAARGTAEKALEGEKNARAGEAAAQKEVQYLNYVHTIGLAHREYQANNIARARELHESCPVEFRDWEWRYVHALLNNELAILKGHTGEVWSASFSGDGRRVVTASFDSTARVWDAETGKELTLLKGHTGAVPSASFSGDGRRVVTSSRDFTARVWDAETGKELTLLKGHTGAVPSASFSGDGRRVVTASDDHTARVWDAETGKELAILKGHTSWVRSASFSGDGRRVVTASLDSTAVVWDAETGKELAVLKGHTSRVGSASFSGDGRRVVTSSLDSTARVWDAESGKELAVLKGQMIWVRSASFSGDGCRVVTASDDHTARVWDAETGKEFTILKGHTKQVDSASFSGDGRRVVTASSDSTARVWDAETGKELAVLKGQMIWVRSASFSGDGRRIVTASLDETARVWDTETGKELVLLKGHTGMVEAASFSGDGRRVVTASSDSTARVWDAETGKELAVLKGHTSWVRSASFSRDGRRVVTSSLDGTARVWDAETGKELAVLKGHTSIVESASFSGDSRRVVTASVDTTARVWDAETGKELAILKGHTEPVKSASFSGDGRRVVTASSDTMVRVWDAGNGKELLLWAGHTGSVLTAAFSSDDAVIRTCGYVDAEGKSIRIILYDSRPASATFRRYLEAPPPRAISK
jgi:eukaryotic-like serine/threonine-protein kinase